MDQLSIFDSTQDREQKVAVRHFTLFVDGASRHNPGPSGAGLCIVKDGDIVFERGFYLGTKTNNQAEYLAFLLGFFFIADYYQEGDRVRVITDSQLLAMQVLNKYKINNSALKPLHALAQRMVRLYDAHVGHVLRTENGRADKMANDGIDKKVSPPEAFIELLHSHGITLLL